MISRDAHQPIPVRPYAAYQREDAVGLTAAFSTALGNAGISANVVAAYYHDHIFVPTDKAEKALNVLQGMRNHN